MSDATPSEKSKLPKVDLGGNSLLVIALIVSVCSGSEHGSDRETRQKINELHETVMRLEKKVDALSVAKSSAPSVNAEHGDVPARTHSSQ